MNFQKIEKNTPINIAFLGCGFATKKHSKTLRKFKEVQCYYASRSAEKAIDFNQKFKGKGYFESYEMAITSSEVNVIFIATPPMNHLELTLSALKNGKHVIIEKPPFFKSSDFDIVDAARQKAGKQVMIAENYYYRPLTKKLRELLPTDIIGEQLFCYFNATKVQKTGDWRDNKALSGGGALFEGGIHWINFIANIGLTIEKAVGFQPKAAIETDKSMQVSFATKEGPVGTLLYSWETNTLFFGLRISKIYGTAGSITFESNGLFILVRGKKKRLILSGYSDILGYKAMFKDFFEALHKGQEPEFNLAKAKQDLIWIERINN